MSLRRREVVANLLKDRKGLLVVAGLGSTAWDITAAGDADLNFPTWGAMGQAAMLGLGIALAQPKRRVLVITGDGEMLMGLGSLATIGVQKPENLTVVVIDNERYGETGMQATHTAHGVDLAAVAKACGFRRSETILQEKDFSGIVHLQEVRNDSSGKGFQWNRPRDAGPEFPAGQGGGGKRAARAAAERRHRAEGSLPPRPARQISRRACEKTLASARAPASPPARSRSRAGRS
jgi:hypothetical protein